MNFADQMKAAAERRRVLKNEFCSLPSTIASLEARLVKCRARLELLPELIQEAQAIIDHIGKVDTKKKGDKKLRSKIAQTKRKIRQHTKELEEMTNASKT